MRIAVLSDIHGRLAALDAVLSDVAHRGVEALVHLGDLVGNGPEPNEVVERLRREEAIGVVGNWDLAVCQPDEVEGLRAYLPLHLPEAARRSYVRTRRALTAEHRSFLAGLPAQLRIEEGGLCFLLTHGSPERPDEALTDAVPDGRLQGFFEAAEVQVLVVGHSHVGAVREVGGRAAGGDRLLLNPGSVGIPMDGDPRASYLILDTEQGVRAELVRVPFDG